MQNVSVCASFFNYMLSSAPCDVQNFSRASDEGEQVPLLHGQVIDDLQISKEQRARLEQTEHFEREILALEVG